MEAKDANSFDLVEERRRDRRRKKKKGSETHLAPASPRRQTCRSRLRGPRPGRPEHPCDRTRTRPGRARREGGGGAGPSLMGPLLGRCHRQRRSAPRRRPSCCVAAFRGRGASSGLPRSVPPSRFGRIALMVGCRAWLEGDRRGARVRIGGREGGREGGGVREGRSPKTTPRVKKITKSAAERCVFLARARPLSRAPRAQPPSSRAREWLLDRPRGSVSRKRGRRAKRRAFSRRIRFNRLNSKREDSSRECFLFAPCSRRARPSPRLSPAR